MSDVPQQSTLAASLRESMVVTQLERRGIVNNRLLAAMRQVPRELFVPGGTVEQAYRDQALPIGEGQTISQPFMVARSLELLDPELSSRVLEVGGGSGYQAAVLGAICAEVHSVEVIPELASRAEQALAACGLSRVTMHVGDGRRGLPHLAPFDRIVVAAGAETVPEALFEQLASPGRLVMPVGDRERQYLELWQKDQNGNLTVSQLDACVFVPLV